MITFNIKDFALNNQIVQFFSANGANDTCTRIDGALTFWHNKKMHLTQRITFYSGDPEQIANTFYKFDVMRQDLI